MLRRTKHGDRLVRAGPGRWSARIEESFLDGLEATGCVRSAARAAGLSVNSFYNWRNAYPEFAAPWDERAGRFQEQLPGLINAAAVESMRPQVEGAKRRGRARLPKLNPGEAIRVYAINENAKAKAGRGPAGWAGGEGLRVTQAERNESILQKLAILERRNRKKRLAKGWLEAGEGVWVPPGWSPPPGWTPPTPDEGNGDSDK